MTKNHGMTERQKIRQFLSGSQAKNCPHTTAERQKTDQITKCKTARGRTQAKNPKTSIPHYNCAFKKLFLYGRNMTKN